MYRPANGTLAGMYQGAERFSLHGWSPEEWARFFGGVEPSASHLWSTIAGKPLPAYAAPQVPTPIGGVPTWALLGGLAVVAALIFSKGRRGG